MNVILHPLSRFLVSLIFIMSGIGKVFDFEGTSAFMTEMGMPMSDLFLVGAIIVLLAGGLSLLFGFKARVGATLLIVFIIPATLIFHIPFITEQAQMINTMKNLAIIGALVKFVADGAGSFSFDEGVE